MKKTIFYGKQKVFLNFMLFNSQAVLKYVFLK